VLIEQHRKLAQDALTAAGTWSGRQQEAENSIFTQQHKNDPAKPTYKDLHPQKPQPTWADTHATYSQTHPQAPRPTYHDLHPRPGEGAPRPETPHEKFMDDLEQKRFALEERRYNPDGTPKKAATADKPRPISATDDQAIRSEAQRLLRNTPPDQVAQSLADEWGISLRQARAFVPGSTTAAAAGAAPTATPGHAAPTLPPTKVNPANGKTYYLHAADGKYYLTP
jgi:hypothetical protein